MEILLSNDDGINAPGLKILREKIRALGKVITVAPLHEQSGTSHALTIFQPIFLHQPYGHPRKSPVWTLNATPVDCIKLALGKLLKRRPSLAVIGINSGANVGIDVFYSGTVAAAMEAALWGITSFAISLEKPLKRASDFRAAGKIGFNLIKSIITASPPPGTVFNINIPAREIKGIKYTRQDLTFSPEKFIKGIDPRGRIYYWMTAGLDLARHPPGKDIIHPSDTCILPSDIDTLRQGYISITLLKTNLTDYQAVPRLPKHLKY